MTAPRPRRRSAASEWPQLSLLALYADQPLLDESERGVRLDEAALEAARVLVFKTPLEQEKADAARRNRVMGTVTGVQGFARCVVRRIILAFAR